MRKNKNENKESSLIEMLGFVFKRVIGDWKVIALSISLLVIVALIEFKIPQVTQTIIDVVIPALSKSMLFQQILLLTILTVSLSVLSIVSTYLMSKISQKAVVSLRQDLYSHILKQDLNYFENEKTGDLMTRLTSDVRTIQDLISPSTLRIISNIITFILVAVFLIYTDWKLSLLIFLTFPILFLVNNFFSKRMKVNFRNVREANASLNNHLQTTLTSIFMIKNSASESYENGRFDYLNENIKDKQLTATKTQSLYGPSMGLVNYLGTAIVLTYGTLLIFEGKLTVGSIVSYLAYLKLLQNPILSFTSMISSFQQALVSYERLKSIFGSEATILEKKDPIIFKELNDKITFENVNFKYQNGKQVLDNINLEIPKGEMIALVGSSGSGKTTITKLLARLYDITDGDIKFDGVSIKDFTIESLRQGIGVVSQDVELIDGSILDNVTYGLNNKSKKEIEVAIEAAKLKEFIYNLEDGLDTQIGERGVKLSGGQKQRIAIARLFLKNAPILILDEATASLDNESEKFIQNSLETLLSNKTSLVIAHRLSTIHNADKILVMDNGKIVEFGNHSELIENNGRYKQLYDAQFS